MMPRENAIKQNKGFTTGSAATAATKASLLMLIKKKVMDSVTIMTPANIEYKAGIYNQLITDDFAECAVIKESGDDPDVTAGIKIVSRVSFKDEQGISITGGEGVGKVTRPGLDQKVGEYAINSTPRKMISEIVGNILDSFDIEYGVNVEISVPDGRMIAEKTFNSHMGIEGGISIIGTSGIVEPMSLKAVIDTIKLDTKIKYSEGREKCIIVPGNYGVTFLKNNYGIDDKEIVLCSNFVGDSMKIAAECGFKKILFCSHIGKMIKVSGGIMNTHSQYGDRRMEFMCDAYEEACEEIKVESKKSIKNEIMNCVSTTAALEVLEGINFIKPVCEVIVKKTLVNLKKEISHTIEIECILYENSYGELARIVG